MNAERCRRFLLALPYVIEKAQFGGIIFCVGDLAVGGKMFVLLNPESDAGLPVSYAAGRERYHDVLESEGMRPAPYLARAFWVAAERWKCLPDRRWEAEFTAAHVLTLEKLTAGTRRTLNLPGPELAKFVAERTRTLQERKAARTAGR